MYPYYFSGGSEALPTVQASDIQVTGVTSKKIDTVSFTRGNGEKVLLVGKVGSAVDALPVDGASYGWDLQFGLGSEIGTGNFVLYKGTSNQLPDIISGLSPEDQLYIRAFEFNGDPGAEKYLTTTATNNPISQTTDKSYKQRVIDRSPFVYWPLNETSGTAIDNAEGTATMDATIAGGGTMQFKKQIFRDGEWGMLWPSSGVKYINAYSAALNSGMNKNEGTISIWFRVPSAATWGEATIRRFLHFRADNNNRFIIQQSSANTITAFRFGGGTNKNVAMTFASQPTTWQHLAITYSVNSNEMKVYLNGVQQGTTQTGIGTFTGNLLTTDCCIGITDTSALTNPLIDRMMGHVAIFNSALDAATIADLADCPYETFLTNQYTEWDINSLFSKTGSSLVYFAYDVDSDGEKELVCNVGQCAHFAAIKSDGTIVWQNEVDATQDTPTRQPQIRNGVLYYLGNSTIYAIRLTDGQVIWSKAQDAIFLNCTDQGVAIGYSNQVDILDYETGNSIGGNWPFTTPFNMTYVQCLAYGDLDEDGFDEIIVNNDTGKIQAIDHDGTDMFFIQSGHGHVDCHTIADVDGDGHPELVTVVDDDNSTNGNVTRAEGDEIVLYDASGIQKDKYTTASVENGPNFHVANIGASGKLAFSGEETKELTLLDANLDVVWTKDLSLKIHGGQLTVIDVDNDGDLELITDTGEGEAFGFRVYDKDGNEKLFFTEDSPTILTELIETRGWNSPKKIVDYGEGYPFVVVDYVTPVLRDAPTGNEKIFWHTWRLKTISGQ